MPTTNRVQGGAQYDACSRRPSETSRGVVHHVLELAYGLITAMVYYYSQDYSVGYDGLWGLRTQRQCFANLVFHVSEECWYNTEHSPERDRLRRQLQQANLYLTANVEKHETTTNKGRRDTHLDPCPLQEATEAVVEVGDAVSTPPAPPLTPKLKIPTLSASTSCSLL